MKGQTLAVIPARGGSKRIPDKNIRKLCGKPIIGYTIEAALGSGIFDRVIVSTDNEKIAEIAVGFGAEVPFVREPSLADDYTPVSLVTLDAVNRLDPDGSIYMAVAQLMANCPLRDIADIKSSYWQFKELAADSQISVTRFQWLNPWWAMKMDSNLLAPIFPEAAKERSQDLPEIFCPTGAIWWIKPRVLRAQRTFHVAKRAGWEIDWKKGVDIDTEEDWELAELLMAGRKCI